MQKILLGVDKLSTWFGQVCSWAAVALTLLIGWEVFSRYVMNIPHGWVLDAQIMLYGVLFMMAGAYTLSKNGHVRGDVLYGFFRPRTQATLDLILYFVFFLPGIVALTYAGWTFFGDSVRINEQTFSADPLPLYPFKFVIPLAGGLLLLQGLVEIVRCVICIREGEWPSREHDVEEVDVEKLKEMVHVKDEDIVALDQYVIAAEEKEMIRKELWFGFSLMAIILVTVIVFMPWTSLTNGHLGLLMLGLVVVAIMLGFPTAFTLMGMGMLFAFFAYWSRSDGHSERALQQTLDLMVQSTFGVMRNDVLISIPLFVFMGYLVERANLVTKLFKSLHLALARVPGSLAVATLVTCAIFATATGIVGAVVTLMGLLALPAMLRAGYDVRLSAGVITAGGCLGILIPPSVLLIVYGATAGVSVPKLYAGAFFPGLMLAGLYVAYVMLIAKWKPHLAPPLAEAERAVTLSPANLEINSTIGPRVLPSLLMALKGKRNAEITTKLLLKELFITLAPLLVFVVIMGLTWNALTRPNEIQDVSGLQQMGAVGAVEDTSGGLQEPPGSELQEPAGSGIQEPPGSEPEKVAEPAAKVAEVAAPAKPAAATAMVRDPTPVTFWYVLGAGLAALAFFYAIFTFARLEVFKMLLTSFFPLSIMILAVLGTILFGLATPTEAAAVGSLGGFILAAVYLLLTQPRENIIRAFKVWVPLWLLFGISVIWFILFKAEVVAAPPSEWAGFLSIGAFAIWAVIALVQAKMVNTVRESTYLTAKTSAMVCWLFVGSSIFSAAFALLGGQNIVEEWVLSLGLTPLQFMLLAQFIIFILGWPLEWTEIIVIFMPIFIPLLAKFGIDPLFFGLLVALNLQTAFLSPPVAMAAFYLKGVSPPHVTLNQIFAGMLPFMGIQVVAIFLLYVFPQIGMWLPNLLYK